MKNGLWNSLPTFLFALASADDLPAICEFLAPFVERQQLLQRTDSEIGTLIKHGFIACSGSTIIGFAAVEVYSQAGGDQALAVAPSFQRQGIGHHLVQMCVERAQRENVVELMAITSSEALFMDCGFHYSLPNQKRGCSSTPRSIDEHVGEPRGKPKESRRVSFDVASFHASPVDQLKSVGKPKETRSVSEGFFDFSNKPPSLCDTSTSSSRILKAQHLRA
ncbi:MAG: GNAT family N-acetyltransferase [Pirellulaceae bacterium]